MIRTLIAVAVAGAFTLPLTSIASDNASKKQEGANPPGQASPGATRGHARFDALDRNHDGYLSRDEAKDASELNTRFSELDKDNDGKLSRDEYGALHSGARGATGSSSATRKQSRAGAPDKGPGAQEPANRTQGSSGGQPEFGGASKTK